MLEAYVTSIKEHVAECVEDLDELALIAEQREWSRIERKAVERLLQVVIEACVGMAKQWLKHHKKVVPSDARQAMQKLADYQQLAEEDLDGWHKVIGMRNAIVHDYLNLDPRILKTVVTNKGYLNLQQFIDKLAKSGE
jgi:uncharacterized protein YutE (UPF0331/DUF86 family)